jgi:hypothetical protein
MSATKKHLESQGYSFNSEFCGYPTSKIVVRFKGEFISSESNEKDALLKAIFHDDKRTISILN